MKPQKTKLNVGIIGCGLIGFKRANAIIELGRDRVAGIYDINTQRLQDLAGLTGAEIYSSWQSLIQDDNIDCVIVAAYHNILPRMAIEALKHGKHVLAEKPFGNNATDARRAYLEAKKAGKILKVGFNHRFHGSFLKAKELCDSGAIGKVLYIRGIYGHGGRKDYDLEWRLQKKFTRGGEMYDQGSHMTDLSLWFLDPIEKVFANAKNYFWTKTDLEDNAFCQLVSKSGQISSFQVSLTQWKNRFNFEIYGNKGYLLINGLGRSYGVETLIYGKREGLGQVPKEKIWEFRGQDPSWVGEWKNFRGAVLGKYPVMSSGAENYEVMKIIDGMYKSVKTGRIIKL